MYLYILGLIFLTPFFEWGIHRYAHTPPKLKFHHEHHLDYHNNNSIFEYWPIPFMTFFYYFGFYFVFLGILKYWMFHNTIHYYPEILPKLSKHHLIHHQDPKYNFSVSSRLPDMILGTYREREIPKRVAKL